MKKILLITISLFFIIVTLYKFVFSESNKPTIVGLKVEEEKKKLDDTDKSDQEKYQKDIITEKTTSLEFELIADDVGISGKIYINKDGYLFIYDITNNINYKISDKKFITLKEKYNLSGLIDVYGITTENELYHIYIFNTTDIKKTKIMKISTEFKVLNFTSLNFKNINDASGNNVIILSDDGNIYDSITGIRYVDTILSLNGYYYIYEDNTIANSFGNMMRDSKGKYLKIKNYIETFNNDGEFENVNSIIITEDNRIIYSEDNNEIKIYNKNIKGIEYKIIDETVNEMNITIMFNDNKKIVLNGMFYQDYYGLKKIDKKI